MNFLNHPAINKAYIAEQLYGNSDNAARKKMSLKVRGKHQWSDEEKEKLLNIQQRIVKELAS